MKNMIKNNDSPCLIELADPKLLGSAVGNGLSDATRQALTLIANHRCNDLEDFSTLLEPVIQLVETPKKKPVFFGHEKFDSYDDYFEVGRVEGDPRELLACASVKALFDMAIDAAGGHNLDPYAVSAFLKSIRIQAKLLLGAVL